MEALCKVCDEKPAAIICLDCTKNEIMCKDCFNFIHKTDSKKAHKTKPFVPGKMSEIVQPFPNPALACLCKEHNIPKKYICKKCEFTICAECLVESHKDHDTVKFAEMKGYFKGILQKIMSEYETTLSSLKKMKDGKNDKYTIYAKGRENAKANVEKEFAKIKELIKTYKLELFAEIDRAYSQVPLKKFDMDTEISECTKRINSIQTMSKQIEKEISPDQFDVLMNVKVKFPSDIIEKIEQCNKLDMPVRGEISNQIFVASRNYERINFGNNFTNIIEVISSHIKHKGLQGCSNFYWNLQLAYDSATKQVFIAQVNGNTTQIMAYSNIENFIANNIDETINFDFNYGPLFAAYNGYIFCTKKYYSIIQYEIKSGKMVREMFLHDPENHPKESCEICKKSGQRTTGILSDSISGKIYAIVNSTDCKGAFLRQIVMKPDGAFVNDKENIQICHYSQECFIFDNKFYFVSQAKDKNNNATKIIQYYYDLEQKKCIYDIKPKIPLDFSTAQIIPIDANSFIINNFQKGVTIEEISK